AIQDPNIDFLIISQDAPSGMAQAQVDQYMAVAEAVAEVARVSSKPIVAISNVSGDLQPELQKAFDRGGVPLLRGTRPALKAVNHMIWYAESLKKSQAQVYEPCRFQLIHPNSIFSGPLATSLLTRYGVPCAKEILCKTKKEVNQAAVEIGYPVALKVVSPKIPHKTEAGTVWLNIHDEKELKSAYYKILEQASRFAATSEIEGILVQEMVVDGVAEAIVGILNDEAFGPVVLVGSGGIFVELLQDIALGVPPFTPEEALELICSTKLVKLLSGFRGKPPGDVESLVDVLLKVGRLALDCENLKALDINPLFILPKGKGVKAVDALVELKPREGGRGEKVVAFRQ
ncbi:MAG: acetate--CoA ligase family protein, partial [Candidatus Methanomethylicaceae archaeon]